MTTTTATDVEDARVKVTIGDGEYELKPTPRAILALSRKYSGFAPLNRSIGEMNADAIIDVLSSGVELTNPKAAKQFETDCVMHGIILLQDTAFEFLEILAHGGRRPKKAGADDGDKKEGDGDPNA